MSTAGTIKLRHQTTFPNTGADISASAINDSLVIASAANDGSLLVKDSAQTDGWGLVPSVAAGQVFASVAGGSPGAWTPNPAVTSLVTGLVGTTTDVLAGIQTNGVLRWYVTDNGSPNAWKPNTDNGNDIGGTTARVRSGYFGTALVLGTSPAATGDFRVRSGFTLKANNNAGIADGTILATDGLDKTVLGGQSVSVANNGIISLGATMNGFLIVQTINYSGLLAPRGAVHAVTIVSDPTGSFSVAAGTGGLVNVYWSVGNSRYELENKTGVTISATLLVLGVI